MKATQVIPGDDKHKLIILEERFARCVDYKKYNADKQFETRLYYPVKIGYENHTWQDILKSTLPKGVEVPGGFETVGDIAHMNLSDAQMPYKNVIGQAILDKNQQLRTVVTKIGIIEATYRFYNLECIAGEPRYDTVQVEDKVRIGLDVSTVYWSSKLATERTRMVNEFLKDGEVLCDMFCGVGPLVMRAAAKRPKMLSLANDLNPEAVEFLKKNIKMNKVEKRVLPFNMDARKFLRMCVDSSDQSSEKANIPKQFLKFHHCYMNLPMDAFEFLDCFVGAFRNADKEIWMNKDGQFELPLIHVYGFTTEKEPEAAKQFFIDRIRKAMRFPEFQPTDIISFHNIRDVSAVSHMYSTTFRLPEKVAFSEEKVELDFVEPE